MQVFFKKNRNELLTLEKIKNFILKNPAVLPSVGQIFLRSLIFGSRGGDRYLDAREGGFPIPPSPIAHVWLLPFLMLPDFAKIC